ncbi:MAG: phage N-6-adenine-methyltransferase [Methyloceanibacter sp.]|nr:phage N-6-adenine-methyltransferase [Methyloceanibacter sp.]
MGRLLTGKEPSGKTEWQTPPELIAALLVDLELPLGFALDAAARVDTSVGHFYYGLDHEHEAYRDGLAGHWWGSVFVNPPYGRGIGKWARKAYEEVESGRAQLVVALLPVNSSTHWWHRYVMEATEIRLLERRVTFVGEPSGAPFENALIIWRRHQLHRRYLMGWNWPRVGESSRQQDTGSVPETAVQGRPASQG